MRRIGILLFPVLLLPVLACGPPDPETLYTDLGCPRCHGFHREGNRYGPTLQTLAEDWDSAESLVKYFHDPSAVVAGDQRLQVQDAEYELKMQPVTGRSDEDLTILADWLLTDE